MLSPLLSLALLAAPAPVAAPDVFALIVTYNGAAEAGQPPLHYADDDGAKYYEVFTTFADRSNVRLLTDFDPDSARLFPELLPVTLPPTKASLLGAAADLARRIRASRAAGRATELYFVFAGHGDVDHGRGFLQLQGDRFDGDDLEQMVHAAGAGETHVILDSCNSFFVLAPRRPGGRRFATPQDAVERLSQRLPHVGVFLSTNAEAEVYEWSELQSGIFSHAVRSGLLGAADADGDGRVSYDELAAFVARATGAVKNPLFRPKIFARGPEGNGAAVLLDLDQARGVTLDVDERDPVRLVVRDREGLRWIDAYKEAGARMRLHLPEVVAEHAIIERLRPDSGAPVVEQSYELPGEPATSLTLAGLVAAPTPPAGRGGVAEALQPLFSRPFGPRAFAAYQAKAHAQPEPVFGITARDRQRIEGFLREVAAAGRQRRDLSAGVAFTLAGAGAALATYNGLQINQLPPADRWAYELNSGIFAAAGSAGLTLGIVNLVQPSEEERILARFDEDIGQPGADPAEAVAHADSALGRVAEKARKARKRSAVFSWIATAVCAGLSALDLAMPSQGSNSPQPYIGYLALDLTALEAYEAISATWVETPVEHYYHLWRNDPDIMPRFSVAPMPGGASLALSGRF